jgi:hypothetical protein
MLAFNPTFLEHLIIGYCVTAALALIAALIALLLQRR